MERIKEFLSSPKKTTILGLIFSILATICCIQTFKLYGMFRGLLFFLPSNALYIGLLVYFSIVISRLYNKKGNINIANRILIILLIISTIMCAINSMDNIVFVIINIIFILYLCNILFGKIPFINNKIFAIAMVISAVYRFINILGYINISSIMFVLTDLAIIPYFYNYYNQSNKQTPISNNEELEALGIVGNEKELLTSENEDNKAIRHKLYELFCNEIKGSLKAPTTAVFCKENELIIVKQGDMYYISGWVDSQNSYGAMIRTNINKFKIKSENGMLIPKSNARVMASNSLMAKLATNWVVALIFTIITGAIIYFIMFNTIF